MNNQEQIKKTESIVELLKGLSFQEARKILSMSIRKCEEDSKLS